MNKIKSTIKKIRNKAYDHLIQKLIRTRYKLAKPTEEEKKRIRKLYDDYLSGKIRFEK